MPRFATCRLLAAVGLVSASVPWPAASAQERAHHVLHVASQSAATITAVADGPWSDPATWGGAVPGAGADVVIPAGRRVILDVMTPGLAALRIAGELTAGDTDVGITSGRILVTGEFRIGTAASPFLRRAVIVLTGPAPTTPNNPNEFGSKTLAVHGGVLSFHGRPVTSTWTRLAADVSAGATQLTLLEPTGWRAGDRIVIATSTRDQGQHDVAEVAQITGTSVVLAGPLRFPHVGSLRQAGGRSFDLRAEVGLLSHNIVVDGDASSESIRFGGHAMFMDDGAREARVQLSSVEFRRMGQLDLGGRYPVHFHLMGATRDCYVRDVAIHSTIQRGLVLHGTSGVTVSGAVVYNTVGHNVVIEDVNTVDNVLDRNLALVNRQGQPLQQNPVLVAQNDRLPSNYWMKAARNVVTRNAAAGSFNSGFNYDGIDGTGAIDFRRNVVHAAMGAEGRSPGDFDLMGGLLLVAEAPRGGNDVIADLMSYHNRFGVWPEETGPFVIDRLTAVENEEQTFNRGVGNRVTYRDAVFVGALDGRRRAHDIVKLQYGSDVTLERPVFIHSGGAQLASPSDVAEAPQGTIVVRGGEVVGTAPGVGRISDGYLAEFDSDVLAPRGHYVPEARFALPSCVVVRVGDAADPVATWRCPETPVFAEVDVRERGAVGTRLHTTRAVRRSDGVRYAAGMFGYSVLVRSDLRYALDRASSTGYVLRLGREFLGTTPPDMRATIVIPSPVAPVAVVRGGTNPAAPPAAEDGAALRPATSAADFAANPLTTFWFDAAARTTTVTATPTWLIVRSGIVTAAACATGGTPAGRTFAAALAVARESQPGRAAAEPARRIVTAGACR